MLDLTFALLAAVILAPLAVTVMVLVRWRLGAPILFAQRRAGQHGEPFMLYKFRTMGEQRDAHGRLLPDDQRLTPFGKWLRRLSLDELPQFFNVIRGDMSLVGPRPLLVDYLGRYSAEQARRHDVRPGITGWAQINGRNALDWESKFQLDTWYVDHVSWWTDVRILFRTVLSIFRSAGISAEGHATMPEFRGSASQSP